MTKYYTLTGIHSNSDSVREIIFGSFNRDDVEYEKEAVREEYTEDNKRAYKGLKIEVSDAELTQEHLQEVYPEMMAGSFVITEDHLDGVEKYNEGLATPETVKAKGQPFRLLDDDGILYYSGICLHDGSESAIFAPLDWGMYNAGCTEIQYLEKSGEWETV